MTITQSELKSKVKYSKTTGLFHWKHNGIQAGCIDHSKNGYVIMTVNNHREYAHRLAWLYVYGYPPVYEIDHRNRNRNDNRIKNLRDIPRRLNSRNLSSSSGVSFMKSRGKWRARIMVDGKEKHLGMFIERDDAISARKQANILYGFNS